MPEPEPRLRVAIDARYWRSSIQTGVERYVLLLLEALAHRHATLDVAVVVTSGEAAAFPVERFPGTTLLHVADRSVRAFDRALRSFAPDLVHYPFDLPEALDHKAVYTLHDPGRYLFPELMVARIRDDDNDRLREQLRDNHLKALITVSEASRTDILATLGTPPCPLHVVPNFISHDFAQLLAHARADARSPSEAASGFLLGVGVYMPLKNVPRLIEAFHAARAEAPHHVPDRLLLVGRRGWERHLPRTGRHGVEVLGHIADPRLATLYATCTAFVFPTLYEGFGMPAHEALAAGARVLCSDIPVLHEIGADLVTYADPRDVEALAKAIIERCASPGPTPETVDRHLASYTARDTGLRLEEIYRASAA